MNYDQDKILELIQEIMNDQGKILGNGEVAFYCPICNHHKRKLQVNLKSQKWRCWICEDTDGTKGKSLFTFLKKMGATKQQRIELSELVKNLDFSAFEIHKSKETEDLRLPSEYIPILSSKSILSKHALKYLYKRNLNNFDILKYQLGICEDGKYKDRIIIPSFDENGKLNYFTARDVYKSKQPYLNPKYSKDIIGFELFINWKLPIILVEGPFDAMAIKRNVIPLFGKTIPPSLKNKIIKYNVKEIYLALDQDAISKTIGIAEQFLQEEIEVHILELDEKDPSEMGMNKFFSIIHKSKPIDFTKLIEYKLYQGEL